MKTTSNHFRCFVHTVERGEGHTVMILNDDLVLVRRKGGELEFVSFNTKDWILVHGLSDRYQEVNYSSVKDKFPLPQEIALMI